MLSVKHATVWSAVGWQPNYRDEKLRFFFSESSTLSQTDFEFHYNVTQVFLLFLVQQLHLYLWIHAGLEAKAEMTSAWAQVRNKSSAAVPIHSTVLPHSCCRFLRSRLNEAVKDFSIPSTLKRWPEIRLFEIRPKWEKRPGIKEAGKSVAFSSVRVRQLASKISQFSDANSNAKLPPKHRKHVWMLCGGENGGGGARTQNATNCHPTSKVGGGGWGGDTEVSE